MNISRKQERDIEEKLDSMIEKSKQREEQERERRLYDKATRKDRDNMNYLNRVFPYVTEQHLTDTLTRLYPELNELFIIDLDQRDIENTPLIKTRNFRGMKTSLTTQRYWTGRVEHTLDVKLKLAVAVIENGKVYIKSAQLRNGEGNRRFRG